MQSGSFQNECTVCLSTVCTVIDLPEDLILVLSAGLESVSISSLLILDRKPAVNFFFFLRMIGMQRL